MKDNLNFIKFNLTPNMSLELIKFNDLKMSYDKLKNNYDLNKNEENYNLLVNKQKELNECKKRFIKAFQEQNRNEIKEYLKLKDQS